MFNPTIVDRRLVKLADAIRAGLDPRFKFVDIPVSEVANRVVDLQKIYDFEHGRLLRALSDNETAFIKHEIYRSKADFLYWANRYAFLKDKNASLVRFSPTVVQELLLKRIGDEELAAIEGKTGDGIIFMVLKARQLGVSTISDIIISHRAVFFGNITAIIASDIDDHTQNLYEMVERVVNNLPWWMQPVSSDPMKDYRKYNKQIRFHDQDSTIRFSASKNMAGGDSGQEKGSMGTGQTLHLAHLSELALWVNPEQIDDALMPSIPMSPRTFAIFESTAKGRGNWWHVAWEQAKRGLSRRKPVFIPWYTDPHTYKLPPPTNWSPSTDALAHAERVRINSPRWVGKSVILSKEQLYWWERTKAEYKDGRKLHKFLAEYTADDLESFQNTTVGVFSGEMIDEMRAKTQHLPVVIEVRPKISMEPHAS